MGPFEKLKRNNEAGRYACAGLDPDRKQIPPFLLEAYQNDELEAWSVFLKTHIQMAASEVAAFKPNWAFYLAHGHRGLKLFENVCAWIREAAPEALLIADMKIGDIGNTNLGYVEFIFNVCQVDVVTVHPYMGSKAMQPFLENPERGVFVLAQTSNPGAEQFQGLLVTENGLPLSAHVAKEVARDWNANQNCGLVTGATYPEELECIRRVARDLPLLLPGIGKQGGDLAKSVFAACSNGTKAPFTVNQSSGFLYASQGADFAVAGLAVLEKMNTEIRQLLAPGDTDGVDEEATHIPS